MSQITEHPAVRAHREIVERLWTEPLLELCAQELPRPQEATVLSAESRCGAVVLRWLEELPEGTRMMALDSSGPMLDEARDRMDEADLRRVFFVQQRVSSLSYADGVFNAALCLHGMITERQAREGLEELVRVTIPGGEVMACFPLSTSFPEFYDLLDEAIRALGLEGALERIGELQGNLISEAKIASVAQNLDVEKIELSELSWEVAFGGGREFLQSPLIQETFFPHWIGSIRFSDREDVLRYIENAVDTYWQGRTLNTRVRAVLLKAKKRDD